MTICVDSRLEGGPIFWVTAHRVHHQFSDRTGDPHTPQEGKWWAHLLWMLVGQPGHVDLSASARYAKDLTEDPFQVWISKYHYVPLVITGLLLLALGGVPFLLWGVFFRVTVGPHATLLGQFGDPFVAQPLACHRRSLAEQSVGRADHLRRGLARQPPRLSDLGAARPGLV